MGTMPNVSQPLPGFTDVLLAPEWQPYQALDFMNLQWIPLSYKVAAVYVAIVFLGQKAMKKRAGFELDNLLVLWNFAFAVFSAIALAKLLPELIYTVGNHGFIGSYCYRGNEFYFDATGYWGWLFVMSKAPELGDTMFLILRKRPVIFLHWYHHAATFLYSQATLPTLQAWFRWSLTMNLAVHTIMYFYFGVRAMKIQTPRWVAKFVTTIQLVQFVILCWIFGHLNYVHFFNTIADCQASRTVIVVGGLMYISYLFIFGKFFHDSYIVKRKSVKAE